MSNSSLQIELQVFAVSKLGTLQEDTWNGHQARLSIHPSKITSETVTKLPSRP